MRRLKLFNESLAHPNRYYDRYVQKLWDDFCIACNFSHMEVDLLINYFDTIEKEIDKAEGQGKEFEVY